MSDGEKRKLQLSREDSLRALPVLAAKCCASWLKGEMKCPA